MIDEETPTSVSDQIKDQFQELKFTQTLANEHYRAGSKAELERRRERIDAFMKDDAIRDPDLSPVVYTRETIDETAAKYDSMLAILVAQPDRTPEEDMLIDRIIDKTSELFRYEELLLAMGAVAIEDREKHERIAGDLSIEIMGGVRPAIFNSLVNDMLDLTDQSDAPYALRLKEHVRRQPESAEGFNSMELTDKTREVIAQDLNTLFPGLAELLEEADKTVGSVSPQAAVPLFESVAKIGKMGPNYRVKLSDSESVDTDSRNEVTTIGEKRKDFANARDAVGLAIHEVIVHGSKSKGNPQPGSHDFEEGFATRLQQIITGEHRTPGAQYYLSVGLQAGLDRGGIPRDFRETFEILARRSALLAEKKGGEIDIDAARHAAERQVQRTRRGGAIDTYDASAYFVGAQKAAEWLNTVAELPEFERRRKLLRMIINMHDPTVPEQVARAETDL